MSPMLASMSATPSDSPSSALSTRARWKNSRACVVIAEVHVGDADVVEHDGLGVPVARLLPLFEGPRAGLDGGLEIAHLELGGRHDVE